MSFFNSFKNSTNQLVDSLNGYSITIKREDLIHPIVSGNKFRKLKYNFEAYSKMDNPRVISFGGAFSNHLAATAQAGKLFNIPTIGIVRGEEWQDKLEDSTTLTFCRRQGMTLYCVTREVYKEKENSILAQKLFAEDPELQLLPEGGTNVLAIKGCREILAEEDRKYDVICSSIGTGGTLAGIIESALPQQEILGFNALNNFEVQNTISEFTKNLKWTLISDYTFGGYAKVNSELIEFMNEFYQQYQIPLDPIYTGKMLFGIFDLIKKQKWTWGRNILVIHTGGLQGVKPMNALLQKKGLLTLNYASELFC